MKGRFFYFKERKNHNDGRYKNFKGFACFAKNKQHSNAIGLF
jgi:hypothetical protein